MKFKLKHTEYRGYLIEEALHMKSHSVLIYKDGDLIKCVAGDILSDGSHNAIEKAKSFINQLNK